MAKSHKLKKTIFVAAAIAIFIALPVALLEAALRLAWKAPRLAAPIGLLKNDPFTFTMNSANYHGVLNSPYYRVPIDTNGHGLRDLERPYEKRGGEFRLLAIGDSYAQGHGVEFEQSFLRRAEVELNKTWRGAEFQIIKAGVGGWGPINELAYLNHEGYRFHPDAVLVVFFTGNDYLDAERPDQFVEYGGVRLERNSLDSANWLTQTKLFLRKNVYVYNLCADGVKYACAGDDAKYAEDLYMLGYCRPAGDVPTRGVRRAVKEFREWSVAAKTPVYFLILPHRIQLAEPRTAMVEKELDIDPKSIDPDRPSRIMREILDENKVPYLDARPLLNEQAMAGRVIGLQGDSHYNPAIHSALGDGLARYIQEQIAGKDQNRP